MKTWRPEYSVGHPLLDSQHRHLLELCDELEAQLTASASAATDDAFHELLDCITCATEEHFRTEEALLSDIGIPSREEHLSLHSNLQEELAALIFQAVEGVLNREGLTPP